ncbi:hypothetical protein LZZ90_08285 [Flavobacterium sp. SM15]|uniref:hypothetical protein n=1 Tax=Flavobacterium sp. SM15 TaxID=2908005 RepID=UPI001EDA1F6E|nr:hypothetical protein [Flavobacterium sp. SM15]MCG2611504.1 hypothetical protein [Flavobacterium sp. SM15]
MSCIGKLTANIAYDCTPANRAKGGLETSAVLINRADIDWTSVTQSGATVTNVSLMSGATGYGIEWIKQLGTVGSEVSINDGLDTFTHNFAGRIFGSGADDAERMKELLEGEYVVIVETKFKGTGNVDAFKVFGLENGLKMSEGTYSSAENDGALLFTLASVENYGESYPFLIWNETNYSTTKAKFDNKLS